MYRKILVPSDGSKAAAKAMATAEAERARRAGALEVVAKVHQGDVVVDVILHGAIAGGYDLLVVGNKGMTGASRHLHASVPDKVSHHAPCAPLIVRVA